MGMKETAKEMQEIKAELSKKKAYEEMGITNVDNEII